MEENGKKRGQIEKISAKEASRGVTWGRRKGGATLSRPQTASQLASLADFFSPFSPRRSLVPGYTGIDKQNDLPNSDTAPYIEK